MHIALQYIEPDGPMTEADDPYPAKNGDCQYDKTKAVTYVLSYHDVTKDSPDQLKAALNEGPVAVAIEADQKSFQLYTSGVITSGCGTKLDHGVLAAGYGTENGEDYFLVKNSWGNTWGDKGYVKIGAGKKNICGILSEPSRPEDK